MAGVRSNITAGAIELVFECFSGAEATTMANIVLDNMALSGSGEWESITAVVESTFMKTRIPTEHMNNVIILDYLLVNIIRDVIVPAIKEPLTSSITEQQAQA